MTATRIWLVRHGETDSNKNHLVAGSTDVPLNDTGRAQARTTAQLMANRRWDALYASPLQRATDTARIIGEATGLGEPIPEPRVVEQDYGVAEDMSETEMRSRWEHLADIPGREPDSEVVRRTFETIEDLAGRHPGGDVVIVCHGGVIYWVLRTLQPEQLEWGIRNASVHAFEHLEGELKLVAFDDPLEELTAVVGDEPFDRQQPAAPGNES